MATRKTAMMQTRVEEEFREECEVAATECEMTLSEWHRAVLDSGLAAHKAQMAELNAEQVEVPDPEMDTEAYLDQLEADAAAARSIMAAEPALPVVHPGEAMPEDEPEARNPRDCPHMPQWRAGAVCSKSLGGCGMNLRGGPLRIPTRSVGTR